MKLKRLFSAIGLGLFAVTSVAAGVLAFAKGPRMEMAEATITETSNWYFASSETSWETNQVRLSVDSENDNLGELLERELAEGEEFKFKEADNWTHAKGYTYLDGGSAKDAFEGHDDGSGGQNIKCKVAGTYNFFINNSGRVYAEFANAATIYVQIKDWSNFFVYAFDETSKSGVTLEPLGSWPGTQITNGTSNLDFGHGTANYGGGIGKIAVPYLAMSNTRIIMTDNSSEQSAVGNAAPELSNGTYYMINGSTGGFFNPCAEVAYDISKAIDAADNQSTCDMNKDVAADLVAEYGPYWSYTVLRESLVTSWVSRDHSQGTKQYTMEEVYARLQLVANPPAEDPAHIVYGVTNSNSAWIIVIASVSTISLVALFLVIRKRKHQ